MDGDFFYRFLSSTESSSSSMTEFNKLEHEYDDIFCSAFVITTYYYKFGRFFSLWVYGRVLLKCDLEGCGLHAFKIFFSYKESMEPVWHTLG